MTVVTTVLVSSRPRSFMCLAQMYMILSPETTSPFSSTARQRSASPSKAKPTSSPSSRTSFCRLARWVEPQSTLMFNPSGRALMT